MDEANVVALVRAGEKDAFAEIVAHYQAPITRYLYRMIGDYAMAQDLAQDTFVQAYKGILKTHSKLSLKAWLYRIATNNALQVFRRKRIISFVPFSRTAKADMLKLDTKDSPEDIGEKMAIKETLLGIPQEQRICILLHFVEGFKYREIAEILKISEDAVRMRVARGSEKFRRLYSQGKVT